MNSGSLIKLPTGVVNHFELSSNSAILWEKLPREDYLEYDWKVFVDGGFIKLGRQVEYSAEVINESR